MANVGDLKVLLSADDKASGQVAKSGRNIKETAKGMGKSFALMGGVIAGVFAGAIKDFMDTGDALHKMSLRTRISVEALDELNYIANLSGTSLSAVENMIRRLVITMNEARDGTMIGVEAFEKLGIAFETVENLAPEQAFRNILTVLAEMTDETMQTDAAMAVFGNRMGMEVIPIISGGTEALNAMIKEAKENARFTQESADKAALLTDKMFNAKIQVQALSVDMAEQLTPAVLDMIEAFNKGIKGVQKLGDLVGGMPTAIAVLVVSLKTVPPMIILITQAFRGMATGVALATGGLNLLVGAIIIFGTWLLTTENKVERFKAYWTNAWKNMSTFLTVHINRWIEGINGFLDILGLKTIPLIAFDVPKAVDGLTDSWQKQEYQLENVTIAEAAARREHLKWKKELTDSLDATKKNTDEGLRPLTVALGGVAKGYSDIDTAMEAYVETTKEATKETKNALGTVTKLKTAVADVGGMGIGTAMGSVATGGGGGNGGISMADMYAAFPSLRSAGAQAEYIKAVTQLLDRRKGGTGISGAVTGSDISSWRKEHGAFQTGNFIVNTVTSSGVTKLLNESKKRGMGSEM
tara:strand:+ start:1324 stop:3069 length:1746 start_codon:yes stop_codon:yes gene_type:complete